MSTVTYNGVIMTETEGGEIETWSYSQKVTINDDGTYKMSVVNDGITNEYTSLWAWLDGASKKEQILIDGDIWAIKKLTNKELVLEQTSSSNFISGTYNSSSTSTTTMTFEKQ